MNKKLYISNLPTSTNAQTLAIAFSECGAVETARIVADRDTGGSRGIALIEMSSESEAIRAMERYNGTNWDGRIMKVSIAKPPSRENRFGRFTPGARRGW